jgi:transposase
VEILFGCRNGPMPVYLRAMTDAVFYVARNGVEWRALPVDFPPWEAVWKFFERWSARGLPEALTHRLRGALRERQGRAAEPTAVIVDSQIARAAVQRRTVLGGVINEYHRAA